MSSEYHSYPLQPLPRQSPAACVFTLKPTENSYIKPTRVKHVCSHVSISWNNKTHSPRRVDGAHDVYGNNTVQM